MQCAEQITKVWLSGLEFGGVLFCTGLVAGLVFGVLLGKVHSWSKAP